MRRPTTKNYYDPVTKDKINVTFMTIMKKTIAFLFLISSLHSFGQCNVKTIDRPDGTTVKYLNPTLVGSGTKCELGCSISTNGTQFLFNTTVRYFDTPKKTKGTLMVQLSSNESLVLKMHTNELATMKGEQLSLSVFLLTKSDVAKLKKATIKTIVFKEADDKNQIINVSSNSDFASKHLNCLQK